MREGPDPRLTHDPARPAACGAEPSPRASIERLTTEEILRMFPVIQGERTIQILDHPPCQDTDYAALAPPTQPRPRRARRHLGDVVEICATQTFRALMWLGQGAVNGAIFYATWHLPMNLSRPEGEIPPAIELYPPPPCGATASRRADAGCDG